MTNSAEPEKKVRLLYRSRAFAVGYGRGLVGFALGRSATTRVTLTLECCPPVWWMPRREGWLSVTRRYWRVGWLLFAVGGSAPL